MKTYSYSEARENLATVLEQARAEGSARIRLSDGQEFVVRPVPRESPLDVEGLHLDLSAEEIVAFVREGRDR